MQRNSNKDKQKGKVVYIKSFGCQMNVRDSEIILGMLQEAGYQQAERLEQADVILFNTCSVRRHAEERVWGQVGMLNRGSIPPRFAHAKRNRGDTTPMKKIIGVVGCMAQNYQDEVFRRLPHVDLVCGPSHLYDIPDLIEKVVKENVQVLAVDRARRPLVADCGFRINNLKAFVSIMYGCNNFCSYCIVPYVRGRERSRPLKHISEEVRNLAQRGCKEITLLGQNVNSYGKDLRGRMNFVRLLESLDRIKGIECIRFVTSHPKDASLRLFYAMRDLEKLIKYLHLPVQSGSDRILKLMNRGYTAKHYRELVDKYRDIVPGGRLVTDIIVGFPTETDEDFQKTYDLIKDIKFNCAYIFKYSPRPGTKAAEMKDDVPEDIKEKRHSTLLNLQKEISRSLKK